MGVLITAIVCILAFVVLFIGVVPVNSEDVTVVYEIYKDNLVLADKNGETEAPAYCVKFDFELKNGKVLECRSNGPGKITLYEVYKLPFDDRGIYPNQYTYIVESVETFTEEDALIIQFRDKTVTYNLKQITDEAK